MNTNNVAMNHEIKTDLGVIVVSENTDPCYPGVFINFKPNNSEVERPVALVECMNKNEFNEKAEVRVLVWGQRGECQEDMDYTKKFTIFDEYDMKKIISI